jgi:hypothetical protein
MNEDELKIQTEYQIKKLFSGNQYQKKALHFARLFVDFRYLCPEQDSNLHVHANTSP